MLFAVLFAADALGIARLQLTLVLVSVILSPVIVSVGYFSFSLFFLQKHWSCHMKWVQTCLVTVTVICVGCQVSEPPLRVGTNLWIGYDPIYLAIALGYITEDEIQLVEFTSATESVRAYRNGLVDVAALTGDEVLRVCSTQGPQEVFMVCDWSNGADVLVARPEIATLADLKGKRVGTETTALGAYMLRRALERAQLTSADVMVVNVPLSRHSEAYLSGEVDAIVTFEPHRTNLLKAGARVIFDSGDIPGEVIDVLIGRKSSSSLVMHQRRRLVEAWSKGIDFIHGQPEKALRILSERQGVSEEEVTGILSGVLLVDERENRKQFQRGASDLSRLFERLREFMLDTRMLRESPPLPDFVSVHAS